MTSYQSVQTKQTSASGQAHIIQNDAEALEIAEQFAEQFKKTAVERDAKRILPYTEIDAFEPVWTLGNYSAKAIWRCRSFKSYCC